MHTKPPDSASEISKIPAGSCFLKLFLAFLYFSRTVWIKLDTLQTSRCTCFYIEKFVTTINPMIKITKLFACLDIEPVNHPGLKIRNKKLPVYRIIGNITKRSTGIGTPLKFHFRKNFRFVTILGIKLVNCARPTIDTPHALHPVFTITMQTKSRSSGQINIWPPLIIDSNTKYLPDIPGRNLQALRLIQPMLSLGRFAGISDIDNTANNTIKVNNNTWLAIFPFSIFCTGKSS